MVRVILSAVLGLGTVAAAAAGPIFDSGAVAVAKSDYAPSPLDGWKPAERRLGVRS